MLPAPHEIDGSEKSESYRDGNWHGEVFLFFAMTIKCFIAIRVFVLQRPTAIGTTVILLLLFVVVRTAGASLDRDLFATEQILDFTITISSEGIANLAAKPLENVPALVRFSDLTVIDSTLHVKGHGSFSPISGRPSFSIRLENGTVGGRSKLLLNNSLQDASFLRWKLVCELFSKAGIPAARVNFAQVQLNKRKLGLYLFVEPIDKTFLRNAFGSSRGNLYEGSNNDVGDKLEVDHGSQKDGQCDLALLDLACEERDSIVRWRKLNEILDVDRFVTFMVLEVLIDHHDGYSLDRNNFRIYHNPGSDRLVFIPHGLDLLFGNPRAPVEPQFSGKVARALMETPEGLTAYRARMRELVDRFFRHQQLTTRLDQLSTLIAPVAEARLKPAVQTLRTQIEARCAFLAEVVFPKEP
jgi:spore coat protein H